MVHILKRVWTYYWRTSCSKMYLFYSVAIHLPQRKMCSYSSVLDYPFSTVFLMNVESFVQSIVLQ
jgi:hypothetical protein